jgi:hypothetical protein
MDDQHAAWADAMLRRPAVDPTVPRGDRDLLAAPGTLLTPACQPRPPRVRSILPADPDKRGSAIDGAVTGITAAAFVAIGGVTPYAIGVLVFQGAVGWQSASGRYGLLIAEIIALVTAVLLGTRIVRFGQLSGKIPANVAARTYHGRYLTAADFDSPARLLLRRAQDAVDAVNSAEICQSGLLDGPASLAEQEWDIALTLREQARLRARRAELSAAVDTKPADEATAALLERQAEAARLAEASIRERIAALERYAEEVRAADATYRDWQRELYRTVALEQLTDQHMDMLARTAADEHGIAEIEAMSQQARAVHLALRDLLG